MIRRSGWVALTALVAGAAVGVPNRERGDGPADPVRPDPPGRGNGPGARYGVGYSAM